LMSRPCPLIWVFVYVLPNKVAPITATAAIVKSILTFLFMVQIPKRWYKYQTRIFMVLTILIVLN